MFKNQFISTLYKESRLLKNRFKSYSVSVILGYLIVLFVILFVKSSQSNTSPNFIIFYSTVYMGFLSFIYLMRFWEEKVTGTMEYSFTLGISIRRIIILKVLVYTILAFCYMFIFFMISSIIFLNFNILYFLLSIATYLLIVIPYGLINGSGMWCLNNGLAKLIQLASMGLIIVCIGGVVLMLTNSDVVSYYLPIYAVLVIIFWIIGITLLYRSNKEKAIKNMIE